MGHESMVSQIENIRASSQLTDDATVVMEELHGSCPLACASSMSSTPRNEDSTNRQLEDMEAEVTKSVSDRHKLEQEW
jgi:hypothetical protein